MRRTMRRHSRRSCGVARIWASPLRPTRMSRTNSILSEEARQTLAWIEALERVMIETRPLRDRHLRSQIPPEHDPRLVDWRRTQRPAACSAQPDPACRTGARTLPRVARSPKLRLATFERAGVLQRSIRGVGTPLSHSVELAALAGVLASAGVSAAYAHGGGRSRAPRARLAPATVRHHDATSDHPGRLGSLGPRHGPHANARRSRRRSTPPR